MNSRVDDVVTLLKNSRKCVLTTHVNPDGDGLGSELALARFLRSFGKEVTILNHNGTPDNYRWMDPEGDLIQFQPERDARLVSSADLVVVLDTNQPDRLRSLQPFIENSDTPKLVIDHHLEPHPFSDHYYIDDDATSTGELIFRLIQAIDPSRLTLEIAVPLYVAVMTDTGSFKYPRTDGDTHRMVGQLIDLGVVPIEMYSQVYEGWSPGRMRLLGEVLDSMKTAYDGKVAWVVCTRKMFNDTGTSEVETDSFTTYPMSVRGVVVGILFNELPNGVKISFRSKGAIPINELAKEFGGNGHLNAAGARLHDVTLEEIVPKVIEKAGSYAGTK